VAVVGNHFWACKKAREALETEWDLGPTRSFPRRRSRSSSASSRRRPAPSRRKGENPAAVDSAPKKIVAEYEVPFLAHAPMEPLNCTVEVRDDGAEIWVGSQFQGPDQQNAAKILGFKPEQVKLNTLLAGGGFGRRANPVSDYIMEACVVASKVKKPVKVVWTREDDIKGGFYRPMYVHRVEVGMDASGKVIGWKHAIVGPSIVAGTAFEGMMVKGGVDPTSTGRGRRFAVRDPEPAGVAQHRGPRRSGAVVALGGQLAHRVRDGDDDGRARGRRGQGSGRFPQGNAREEPARAEGAGPRRGEGQLGIAASRGTRARHRRARGVRQRLRAGG
jgi:hypothetical protein